MEFGNFGHPQLDLVGRDLALACHRLEHKPRPTARAVQIAKRAELRGSTDDPGKHCGLTETKVANLFAKVDAGGGRHACSSRAEIDVVEIACQDFVLAK